jgi:hypothetical protein
MRYEDMLAEPQMARHLLFKPSDGELADAIKRSSFEQLREQEEKDGFRERPKKAERFFREGRTGQWKDALTPAQIKRIVDAHGEQMARFGYWPAWPKKMRPAPGGEPAAANPVWGRGGVGT